MNEDGKREGKEKRGCLKGTLIAYEMFDLS
jgi:hypothetical protein